MEENILNRPCNEERLRQAVVNVDNEVVIGDGVDFRPRKLSIYQNPLPKKKTNHTSIPSIFQPRNHTRRDDQYHNICPITERERECAYTNPLANAERVYVAVGHIPVEEPVRVFSVYKSHESQNQNNGTEMPCKTHD